MWRAVVIVLVGGSLRGCHLGIPKGISSPYVARVSIASGMRLAGSNRRYTTSTYVIGSIDGGGKGGKVESSPARSGW